MTLPSCCINQRSMRAAFNKTAVLSGLLAALIAAPAFADDVAEVSKLLHGGQFAAALSRADAFLAKNPRDAQMRFVKGVILTEQNKSAEAIVVFTKLTEDFPNLPEPYNNLAVLHAAAGQYDKARAALDAAIRTNPAYATAYENLGDVHAKLASQAYDKALQLDSDNSAAKSKLTLVRSLVGNDSGVTVAAATPAPKTSDPAAAQTKQAATPAAAPAATPRPPIVIAAKPEPKVEPKAESKPEPKAEPKATADSSARDDVIKAVNKWAQAWSAQDMQGYLGSYASSFSPAGKSRNAWEQERRARIVGPSTISVTIKSPKVTVDGNTATARFLQLYSSDRLNVSTRKTLAFEKQGGKWLIKRETTGN